MSDPDVQLIPARPHREARWRLLRDVGLFQIKLALDGVKDIVLAPVTLVLGVLGILLKPSDPGRWFRRVLRIGKGYDEWVDLYGSREDRARLEQAGGLDGRLSGLERAAIEAGRGGGVATIVKTAVDKTVEAIGQTPRDGAGRGD